MLEPPSPPKASSNLLAYSGIALSSFTSVSGLSAISMSLVMGPSACCSKSAARPSQNCNLLKAEFHIVGAPRRTGEPAVRSGPSPWPPLPIESPLASVNPRSE